MTDSTIGSGSPHFAGRGGLRSPAKKGSSSIGNRRKKILVDRFEAKESEPRRNPSRKERAITPKTGPFARILEHLNSDSPDIKQEPSEVASPQVSQNGESKLRRNPSRAERVNTPEVGPFAKTLEHLNSVKQEDAEVAFSPVPKNRGLKRRRTSSSSKPNPQSRSAKAVKKTSPSETERFTESLKKGVEEVLATGFAGVHRTRGITQSASRVLEEAGDSITVIIPYSLPSVKAKNSYKKGKVDIQKDKDEKTIFGQPSKQKVKPKELERPAETTQFEPKITSYQSMENEEDSNRFQTTLTNAHNWELLTRLQKGEIDPVLYASQVIDLRNNELKRKTIRLGKLSDNKFSEQLKKELESSPVMRLSTALQKGELSREQATQLMKYLPSYHRDFDQAVKMKKGDSFPPPVEKYLKEKLAEYKKLLNKDAVTHRLTIKEREAELSKLPEYKLLQQLEQQFDNKKAEFEDLGIQIKLARQLGADTTRLKEQVRNAERQYQAYVENFPNELMAARSSLKEQPASAKVPHFKLPSAQVQRWVNVTSIDDAGQIIPQLRRPAEREWMLTEENQLVPLDEVVTPQVSEARQTESPDSPPLHAESLRGEGPFRAYNTLAELEEAHKIRATGGSVSELPIFEFGKYPKRNDQFNRKRRSNLKKNMLGKSSYELHDVYEGQGTDQHQLDFIRSQQAKA